MRNRGMSLVEIIVVVAIMSILIGVGGYGLSLSSGKPAEECARKLASEIEYAKMATMGKYRTTIKITSEDEGKEVWVEETSYTVDEDGNRLEQLERKKVGGGVKIECEGLELGEVFEFNRASGALEGKTGTVVIHISKANTRRKITIYGLTGKIALEAE